ncbi:dTDP-4-dehydrorhamnose reductase [Snodgrassella communis]|uniref:dTDP-4-dehydrorhamnose reductase n=1 Tax=Snodgrassella communis TaxID=2946699 RepID=A0A836Z3M6_9NEIS|nr:dTDP-4-dehydrorhamnose reductase [Snodgrassella communis]KDN15385.1 dTDP-4-dehydrorhamnose reductase [Snodgrassella communis]PIT09399.1 dTDP-4-dehydrorhamnose reductase [Snodgrassella communis]PIT26455.1 dTDP-4-dehydrorhamnose reductase [Snodgrassella communis]PIT28629.1 dTDP-4-dehydrorhamnose reductase [Snodgrassella communis]PIT31233.1 dTDP-4-dehydrorhamnose reductase [Snodgrassella communis]
MRILLTGSKGQVGSCLRDRLPENWELIASDSQTLNITDAHNVHNMVKTFEPDIIINAAGYTKVDAAETDIAKAFAVNATGTLNLAQAARTIGARLIHLSTEQVFDGYHHVILTENMAPNPLNVYGHSKLAGELLALNAHIDTAVIRTSWVYSEHGHNFVKIMLQKGLETSTIRVVDDQIGCPTYAGDLAEAIIRLAALTNPARGIMHFAGSQQMSWADFAQRIFAEAAEIDERYKQVKVERIATADYQSAATRPEFGILDSRTIQNILPEPVADTPLAHIIAKLLA